MRTRLRSALGEFITNLDAPPLPQKVRVIACNSAANVLWSPRRAGLLTDRRSASRRDADAKSKDFKFVKLKVFILRWA